MVKAEFLHNVGVNYLFVPWISWLLLLQSAPFISPKTVSYLVLWWLFTLPVVALDVKIYGQWFTKGKRFLPTAAIPTNQLSVIGNLVGAQAVANMGWKETAVCLFSLGIVHYFVLFVTLYQRFSGSDKLPAMLRPVFFLFLAAPSVACLAWEVIGGAFDIASKMLFFLSLFLFTSLSRIPNNLVNNNSPCSSSSSSSSPMAEPVKLEIQETAPAPPKDQRNHLVKQRLSQSVKSTLARFHAGYFRISLSLAGQTLLWKTLISPTDDDDDHSNPLNNLFRSLHPKGFLVLWSFAFFISILLSLIYIFRCLFLFRMVKAEFLHDIGVNYLFTPWISWLLLLQSAPFKSPETMSYIVLWWFLTVPVVALDVKIYGQWFTKGKRFLPTVANPTSQLSVIGNLVGAQAAANMGWKEIAVCLFSLGIVHYFVLFVTLYQRFPGSDKLPAMLRPVFFLFLAAPSVACLAWEAIVGAFDIASKMLFFLSLFLFISLACRPALFKRSMRRFNVAWWAYSFPLTVLAMASSNYAREVKDGVANTLVLLLSTFSVMVFLSLVAFTAINTKMLLPHKDSIVDLHTPSTTSVV